MPPKAARGMATRRGRGRGGKVNETTHEESSSASNQPEIVPKIEDNDAVDSPHDSPAFTPDGSPAQTPGRPPVERLDSLTGRAGAAGRGAASNAGAPRSRFKPRAIRRDVAERQKLEDEEKARLAGIEEKNAAIAARAARSMRGRGGRGRGDAMGRGFERGGVAPGASGPFAVAPAMPDKRSNPFGAGGGIQRQGGPSQSQGGVSSFRTKTEPGFHGSSHSGGANLNADPQYPGEEDTAGDRVDIEYINLVSSDEGDDEATTAARLSKEKGKTASNKGGMRPVRLPRYEHKERVVNLVTSDSSAALPTTDGDVEELDMDTINRKLQSKEIKPSRVWKGVYDDDSVEVKAEEHGLPEDSLHAIKSAPSSPERTRTSRAVAELPEQEEEEPVTSKAKSTRKKDVKPIFQTEEDKAEYERRQLDLAVLTDELGNLQTAADQSSKGKDAAGDVDMDAENDEEAVDRREGRLYLFQFPPVLPRLHNSEKFKVKGKATDGEDVEMSGTSMSNAVDVTADGEEIVIKEEPDVEQADDPLVPEEGFLGKMIVRESGKVEFDWGGNSMIVGRGFDASFLQTVVLTEFKDGEEEGAATGLGSLMGKFIVTPDFEKIFEGV
ncbi:RNA polymerase III RPC4-domain-containing protein [Xylogone sp. PMI_703]|nr:RNA polymerase III RPC4-domain-containing protein [Xylogone sp. PMI_703]